ncbi:MAG: hypothetical protein DHS20C21_18050 [Gemmatimonadota bacterium]|nr:MAG: hypothetical protein DHS20C21_18050 [Gemmatimonadota bacterium]
MSNEPKIDLLEESAHLIANGVRPIAIIGSCSPDQSTRIATLLAGSATPNSIPFLIDREDGFTDYGYAAASWAIDLLEWATNEAPETQLHRIRGLLCGYSASAIRGFEENQSGRRCAALASRSNEDPSDRSVAP